jgi:CAAX protease family protein
LAVSSNLIQPTLLNIIPPYRALIFDFILFLSFGGLIWTINIIGHSTFPGNNLFPFLIRSAILLLLLAFTYYANYKFSRKNLLNFDILKFKPRFIKYYLGGILLGCLLIAAIWAIIYVIYPFEIIKNPYSKINVANDVIFYSLGNTFEELLFRGFVLLASVKLFGKMGGVFFVSLLFGLFHLQGNWTDKRRVEYDYDDFYNVIGSYFRHLLYKIHLDSSHTSYNWKSSIA